jgi:hypothetical protein
MPVHRDLAEVPSTCPADRPLLAAVSSRSRLSDGLGNLAQEWCDKAGLSECSAQGLATACAQRLGKAGASAHEIMAGTGRGTLVEVQLYSEAALRKGPADSSHAKPPSRPVRARTLANFPNGSPDDEPRL